jgi:ABC-2 type transport system permease protein
MRALTGTSVLIGMSARMSRTLMMVWCLAIPLLSAGVGFGIAGLYPGQFERDAYRTVTEGLPASHAINGPPRGLDTVGGIAVFEAGWYLSIAVAVFAISVVIRCSRNQEQTGRLELLRAGRVSRHAGLISAFVLAVGGVALIAFGSAAALLIVTGDAAGSMSYGSALCAIGVFFAAVAAVAAQISESSRGSIAAAGGVLAASFAIRAVGDASGGSALLWFSPLGVAQATHPFEENRTWPVLALLLAAAVLVGLATLLEARRDHGAGIVRMGLGSPVASDRLEVPWRFATRLLRSSMAMWAFGSFLLGIAFGAVGKEISAVAMSSQAMLDLIGGFGGVDVEASYFTMAVLILSLIAAGGTISAVLGVHREEQLGRADMVLSKKVGRSTWLFGYIIAAVILSIVIQLSSALGLGIAHGIRSGKFGVLVDMLAAMALQWPAVSVLAALAVALFGYVPRLVFLVWAVFAGSVVISMLGVTLRLPGLVLNLSVFAHSPRYFEGAIDVGGAVVLVVLAVCLTLLGSHAFRKRDLV